MKDISITYLMLKLIDIVDKREHINVSCEEVFMALKSDNIISWLILNFPNSDFSIYSPIKAVQITKILKSVAPTHKSENGICWLLNLCVELLQQKK